MAHQCGVDWTSGGEFWLGLGSQTVKGFLIRWLDLERGRTVVKAGVTDDIVLDGQGYNLGPGRDAYEIEAVGFQQLGMAAGQGENEVMTGNAINSPTPWQRCEWSNWRGVGRWFWDGVRENRTLADNAGKLGNNSAPSSGEGLVADLVGLRPLLGGAVLGLTPAEYYFSGINTPNSNSRTSCFFGGYNYLGVDNQLYRVGLDANGNFSSLSAVSGWTGASASGAISCMTMHNGLLYICQSGQNLASFDGTNFSNLGYQADFCASYGGVFFVALGSTLRWLVNNSLWYLRDLGTPITAFLQWDGALWIGGESGLFRAEGRLQPKDPVNNVGTLDYFDIAIAQVFSCAAVAPETSYPQVRNFYGMCAFDGWLWFWQAGRIWRGKFAAGSLNESGVGHFQVEAQPIFGSNRGLAVCGGLIVAVLNDAVNSTVWAYDPLTAGWWAMARSSSRKYLLPFSLSDCHDGTVCAFVEGAGGFSRWPVDGSTATGLNLQNFGAVSAKMSGQILLPQFGAEELARFGGVKEGTPTAIKLLRVGIEWDAPTNNNVWPNLDSYAGQISFQAGISNDGGQNFVTLINAQGQSLYNPGNGSFGSSRTDWLVPDGLNIMLPTSAVNQVGSAAVAPTGWLVRLTCTANNIPVGPAIRRIWVDFRAAEVKVLTGRKWKLTVRADNLPEAIGLNGQTTNLSGMQACANLWNIWQSGRTVSYYDLDGSGPYNVKVGGLNQKRAAIGQGLTLQPDWLLGLELAEVVE